MAKKPNISELKRMAVKPDIVENYLRSRTHVRQSVTLAPINLLTVQIDAQKTLRESKFRVCSPQQYRGKSEDLKFLKSLRETQATKVLFPVFFRSLHFHTKNENHAALLVAHINHPEKSVRLVYHDSDDYLLKASNHWLMKYESEDFARIMKSSRLLTLLRRSFNKTIAPVEFAPVYWNICTVKDSSLAIVSLWCEVVMRGLDGEVCDPTGSTVIQIHKENLLLHSMGFRN